MASRDRGRDTADVILFTVFVLFAIVVIFFALGYLLGAMVI